MEGRLPMTGIPVNYYKRRAGMEEVMRDFNPSGKSPSEIQANCSEGADCKCVAEAKPWNCPNWGRSNLAAPGLNHEETHYTGQTKGHWIRKRDDMERRREKNEKHKVETEKRLSEVRHADPRKHLRKKGVKI
jgi:hypothetical protein